MTVFFFLFTTCEISKGVGMLETNLSKGPSSAIFRWLFVHVYLLSVASVFLHVMMYHVCIALLCTHGLYLKHKVLLSFSMNPETKDRVTVDYTEKKTPKNI